MQSLLIFTSLLVSTLGVAYRPGGGGGGWGGIASRRDADAGSTEDVYKLIQTTLDQARKGITAQDLDTAAQSIKQSVDAIIDANGGTADAKEVHALVLDVAKQLDGATAIASLFDDPLGFEASKLDSALHLLDRLMAKGKELEAAGKSNNEVLGAISMTAEAIDQCVTQAVNIVLTMTGDQQEGPKSDMRKRWEFTGGVGYGPGGPSYNVGISHSWKRSVVAKRGWSAGVKGGYGPGGPTVGGSVSYSWRR